MSAHEMHEGWSHPRRALIPFKIAGFAVLGVIGAAVFALVFGWLVMILWNWVMPGIFHLGEITYWEAFGLFFLGKLIFGGFGFRGGHGRGPWRAGPWGGKPWEGRRHPDEWRLYREFWEQEGRQAFDAFVEKKRAGTSPGGSEPKDA